MRGASRKMKKLFVSHISDEAEVARVLQKQLEEDFVGQVQFFTSSDIGSISAGEEWLSAIQKALNCSAAVLVLCSRNSVSRPWVQFELGGAWMKKMRIIPVCHSGMTVDELPMPLISLQSVQLGTEVGVQRLYQAVSEVLDWTKVPAPKQLAAFLGRIAALEAHFQEPVQQFERYVDIVLPPGALDSTMIPPTTKIESNAASMELFGFTSATGRTWRDICTAAMRTPDTRWLTQLQDCIWKASRNELFRPVQAVYHGERASYQPQLAKKQVHPDGSCRYHVHFVETTVAPLTEVQNDFGLLATLLRLGLRFRYEVVEHFHNSFKAAKLRADDRHQAAEMDRIMPLLRSAIEVIENDALSRGAQNFDPVAINALFDRECEQHEMAALQSIWADTRQCLFRTDPPLAPAEFEAALASLHDTNFRFMCLATKRYHEMVSLRWRSLRQRPSAQGLPALARELELAPARLAAQIS